LPSFLEDVRGDGKGGEYIARTALLAYHPAVQARVLREWLQGNGIRLDDAGTRAALEFTRTGVSGRSLFPVVPG
ncbi:TilS substrate-binding domain-containing protein, partial [Gemmatimonadota bacterium]